MIKECFYKPHILESEQVLFRVQKHGMTRVRSHVLFVITAIIGTSALGYFFTDEFQIYYANFALVLFQLGLVGAHMLLWRALLVRRGIVFTDQRFIIFQNSLFSGTVSSIVYHQIAEFELQQSLVGRWLGYGTIWLKLADQGKEIPLMDYEYPQEIENILNERVLLGERHPVPG